MVYKRYIKRGGKLCGPYYYESYRDKNGNVISRYLPDYSPETNLGNAVRKLKRILANKTYFITFGIILTIILLLALGNLNYYSQHQKTTGKAVQNEEIEFSVSSVDKQVAEDLADGNFKSNVDVRTQVDLEIKEQLFKNRIMVFDTPEGKINLEFDLLDYASWVESDIENTETAENFNINVNKSAEKYKWGYNVKLNDLNFMAKINVKADNIQVVDNQTLKIGNNYLSFADLTKQGYIVRVENPVLLSEINLSEENITAINISEVNVTEINITIINETQVNETIVNNITNTDVNESAGEINESVEQEVNQTDIIVEVNITGSEEVPVPECSAIGCVNNPGETGEVAETISEEENVEQPIVEASSESQNSEASISLETITGNIIKFITGFFIKVSEATTGFVINGVRGITGLVVQEQNTISIYVQKDFTKYNANNNLDNSNNIINDNSTPADNSSLADNNTNNSIGRQTMSYEDLDNSKDISIGDIINLDPELIVIMVAGSNGTATDGNIVYQCGTINASGVFTLNQSINTTGSCLTIQANNITINLNGFNMTGDANSQSDYSIDNTGSYANLSVKNGYIYNFGRGITSSGNLGNFTNLTIKASFTIDVSSFYGIYLSGERNYVSNNNISNISSTSILSMPSNVYGIFIGGVNNTVIDNNVHAEAGSSSSAYGINIGSSNNTVARNTVNSNMIGINIGAGKTGNIIRDNTANSNQYGIYFSPINANNNQVINNTLNSNTFAGIFFDLNSNNNLTDNRLNLNKYGIYFSASSNNNITDTNISGSTTNDVFLTGTSTGNIFLNTSYSNENISSGGELIRQWYYQVYVNDTGGNALSGANVAAYDKDDGLRLSITTNSSGWTNKTGIIEYVNNAGTRTYYSNYTIYAYNSTHVGSISYNASQNNLNSNINVSVGTFVAPSKNITTCGALNISNTVYYLQNNLNTTGACLNVTASNIVIDGKGYNMTGDAGASDYGIINTGNLVSITIRNFRNIGNFSRGINFANVNDSLIYNNTFNSEVAQTTSAIYITDGNSNTIYQNNINWNATGASKISYGILLNVNSGITSGNNNITNNSIVINSANSDSWGIYSIINLGGISNSNTIRDNSFSVTSSSNSYGLYLYHETGTSNSNIIYNNIFNIASTASTSVLKSYGLYLSNVDASNITLNTINASAPSARATDVYLEEESDNNVFNDNTLSGTDYNVYVLSTRLTSVVVNGGGKNNTFLNVSYGGAEFVDTSGDLTRKWYYRAHTTNTTGQDVANATVHAYNITGDLVLNITSNNSGWTNISTLVDYYNIGGTRTYQSSYIAAANNQSFEIRNDTLWDSHNLNITALQNILNDTFIMDYDTTAPVLLDVSASVNYNSAIITWNTNEGSNSSVSYSGDVSGSSGNDKRVIPHSLTISGLTKLTAYTFTYTSCDFAGNCASASSSFTTTNEPTYSGGSTIQCIPNYKCPNWNSCSHDGEEQTRTCTDNNNCFGKGFIDVPITKTETRTCSIPEEPGYPISFPTASSSGGGGAVGCVANWNCNDWTKCQAVYDLQTIIEGKVLLKGEQKRDCVDFNKCTYDKTERLECSTKIPVYAKKSEMCFDNFLEIYNEDNVLISRLKLYNGAYQKLNVQMLFDEAGYCPYCFDGQKNYDEDGIDCSNTGKNCPLCIVEKPSFLRNNYSWMLISLIAMTLICFLIIIWYLVLLRKNKKRVRKIIRISRL